MKRIIFLSTILLIPALLNSCRDDVLDLSPLDKVDRGIILTSEEGVRIFLANLYYQTPFEDFAYNHTGFHGALTNNMGILHDAQCGNAVNSEANFLDPGAPSWWEPGYALNRDINLLLETIPTIEALSNDKKNELAGEAHFLRAFNYFALAKRYGGVAIIREYQPYTPAIESLKVPRSTEKETWDFVMSECDEAAKYLPPARTGNDTRRATKWTACALKSRAALHAASVAKYGSKAPLSGEAVALGLVGIDAALANHYYELCIDASAAIMEGGAHRLYKPNPATAEEAANNLLALFQDPNVAPEEAMFCVGYGDPGVAGHSIDFWSNPSQTSDGAHHPGRVNPTLDLVDVYESYVTPGQSAPVVTTADGNVNDYNGYNRSQTYLHFDTPYDIFKNKDARLWATVILPGTVWKGATIRMQAGYIEPDGTPVIEAVKASITVNGVAYHTFGADAWQDYSGFDQQHADVMTRTGFSFKKFLSPVPVEGQSALGRSTQDWMEFRYAEVLLNYAEAVVESGYSANDAQTKAKDALNATRQRAGHTTDIPLTIDNVQRERRVELAFENKRWWDLIRRREFHEVFNNNIQKALCPVLDLRVAPPKYIFIRKHIIRAVPITFPEYRYYHAIPGIGSNGLIQNPNY
ncbi:MAG: RagB/SusD family nutrient uptake outer membrane protein [Prevotellaceae bacterium]|jgi:hypothetical protein|nr:RagB/SusD family nutrient uptake outer membrane protein [Prevotellaceae bacterium]